MEKTIEIDGIKVTYQESGEDNAQPMIMMCGWLCTADTLASIAKTAAESCHVYNLNLPGFGCSDNPPFGWSIGDYADFLWKFVQKLNLTDPVILGHSFGGRVGILYASMHPVSKLILVDAAGIKPRRKLKYYFKVYTFKLGKKLAPIFLGKERAAKWIEQKRGKSGSADYNNSSPVMRTVMSKAVNLDLKYAMPKIKAPTLLIWGEQDTATPLSDAKTMEKLIPDAGLVSFPGCGHYSFLDNPYQFGAVLRSFLG